MDENEKSVYKGIPVINEFIVDNCVYEPEVVDGNILIPIPMFIKNKMMVMYIKVEGKLIKDIVKENDDLK